MSVHPKGKRYEVRWREGTRNRSRTFDRKGDANEFDRDVRRQKQLGSTVPTRIGSTTLNEQFARFIASKHNLAPRTKALYELLWEVHVFDQVGYAPLSACNVERMEDWQNERLTAGAGRESISKSGKLLSQVLSKAAREGRIARDPMQDVERPRAEKDRVAPAPPMKVEEIRAWFLGRERMGDATLVSLMAYGGLRVGESLALQWSDLSQGNRLWISHSLEDDGSLKETKTGKDRLVVLPEPCAEDLLAWRREMGAEGLVFPRARDGKGWTKTDRNNWNRRYFKPACEAVGINIPPKNLRHSAASLRIVAGKRPTEVAEELGHTLATSVNVYQRLMREMEGQPTRPMAEIIREARTSVEQGDANERLKAANPMSPEGSYSA